MFFGFISFSPNDCFGFVSAFSVTSPSDQIGWPGLIAVRASVGGSALQSADFSAAVAWFPFPVSVGGKGQYPSLLPGLYRTFRSAYEGRLLRTIQFIFVSM
jgi:hypothetical protein